MSVVAPRAKAKVLRVVGNTMRKTAAVVVPYRRQPIHPSASAVNSALMADGSRAASSLSPTRRYPDAAAQ